MRRRGGAARRPARATVAATAALGAALGLSGAVSGAGWGDEPAAPDSGVPVVAAVRLLGEADPEAHARALAWLEELARALEASEPGSPRLRVLDRVRLDGALLSRVGAGEPRALQADLGEREVRARAERLGARYVVHVAVTELAGRASLDVRLLPAAAGGVLDHFALEAAEAGGMADALAAVAKRGRDRILAGAAPQPVRLANQAQPPPEELPPEPEPAPEPELQPEPAPPAGARPGGPLVIEVEIRGNRRIEADAVRAVLRTRAGDPLDRGRIAADVRRIYELGFFRNVRVTRADVRGGVLVTFEVEENPVIRRVTISGNDNLDADDIKEQMTITVGSTIDYPLVMENRARIEALYQSRGFYLADVAYLVEPLGADAVSVDYEVDEGEKLRLRGIDFEGNEHLSDGELLAGLQTRPWGLFSIVTHFWDHSGLYAEPLFYQDLDKVQRKYMDRGFIRASVGEPDVQIQENGLRVKVPIDEGPQYRVGEVDVLGDETMDRDELLGLVRLTPGEVFSRSVLADDVERLRARYSDRGFFSARVRPRTDVDPGGLTVDCLFEVEKRELYFVDWIRVNGNTRTRDEVVRRELSLAEGDLYSASALQRSRARIRRLGFFEEVSVETSEVGERDVGVTVDVVERPTGSFSFGAGVGSTDGFLLNASVRQDNLFGRGYAVNAAIDIGGRSRFVLLRFTDPAFVGSPAAISGSFTLTDREFLDFDQELLGFDLTTSYPLDEGETRVGGGYGFTSRDITGFDVQAASMVQREEFQGSSTTSLLTLSARRDTRDDIRFPKVGQVSGLALELAGLGGVNKFVRLEGRTTWFRPVRGVSLPWIGPLPLIGAFPFQGTFVINSRFGWVIPFNDISDFDLPDCGPACQAGIFPQVQPLTRIDTDLELPLSERYFLGGVGPFQVRGYEQRSLGPRRSILRPVFVAGAPDERLFTTSGRDDTGACVTPSGVCNDIFDTDIDDFEDVDLADLIGGNKMFLLNFELQVPISDELGLTAIAFFDMGNAFAEDESFNPADLRFGTGVGVQWFSPFGPLLVQLGFPLDPLEDEDGSVFEFSLGGQQF